MYDEKNGKKIADSDMANATGGAAAIEVSTIDMCTHPSTTINDLLSGACSFFEVKNATLPTTPSCGNCAHFVASGSVIMDQF